METRTKPESVVNIGVDYVTATTTKVSTADRWDRLFGVYMSGLGKKTAVLNLKTGYWRGYQTRQLPGMMVGRRKDGSIIRLTGETAALMYQTVEPMISKVTRIDLQCTYDFAVPYPNLAQLYREMLLESGYNRTKKPAILGDDGQTLYIGSFSSDQFGRIYDRAKSEKLDVLGQRWRYEVVWRNTKAQSIYRTLRQYYTWDEKLQAIYSIVANWYIDHWCDMPSGKPPQAIKLVQVGAKLRTEETSLNYLRSSVKPYLVKLQEAGIPRARILDALGMGEIDPKLLEVTL